MITYQTNLNNITPENLHGFFVGWPNPPSPETHFKILKNSAFIALAIDHTTGNVIGFINAISDNQLSAYIPLLEVLPEYQKKGVGKQLTRKLLDQLSHLYMIDLTCDPDIVPFYEQFGLKPMTAMTIRNFANQNGSGQ